MDGQPRGPVEVQGAGENRAMVDGGQTERRQLKSILITGCGRSGTRYVSYLLDLLGLDVGHEKMGRDGTASWYMVVPSHSPPFGPASTEYMFRTVLHQVRHPLAVIPSTLSFKERSWDYICENLGLDRHQEPLRLGLSYWYHWNLKAGRLAGWRYKVEDMAEIFPEFCSHVGVTPDKGVLQAVAPDINTRRHGRLYHFIQETCIRTRWLGQAGKIMRGREHGSSSGAPIVSWSDLARLDPVITRRARELARSYGYVN